MTTPYPVCEIDHVEDWLPTLSEEEHDADVESRVTFLQILRWGGYGEKPLGIAYYLILEPTGDSGEYMRRGVAEVPVVDGMDDGGWEARTVKIV